MSKVNHEELILALYENQMIKFGEFILKSGQPSHIYADIRTAISYPNIFRNICDLFYHEIKTLNFDYICGVPYSALTFASGIAYAYGIPMLLKRKEIKDYGTKKHLEGNYAKNNRVLIIEDVVTSGASILETIEVIESSGLEVRDICFLMDRNQGGVEILKNLGYNVHYIMDIKTVIDVLHTKCKISDLDRELALKSLVLQEISR